MKTIILTIALALLLISTSLNSQTQKGINYQAVAHNSNGTVLDNKPVGVRFSFIKGPLPGTNLYVETHSINTNKFGLFSVVIGKGQVITGTFTTINWNSGDVYLKVEIDPAGGTNFSEVSTTLLQAVPYALNSEKANLAEGLSPNASGFVKSINGTEGVVTLEGAGGTTITKSGQKITISSSGGGGTGIQGIQNTDGNLTITNPNGPTASINFSQNASAIPKGTAGGDLTGTYPNPYIAAGAIGTTELADLGITTPKIADGAVTTPKIADGAVTTPKITDGAITNAKIKDIAWGKITGAPALGAKSIDDLTDGKADTTSVFLGLNSGNSDDGNNYNTALGSKALFSNTVGQDNTALGFEALKNSVSGNGNIGIGKNAGSNLTSGSNNIYIGNSGVATESNTIRIGNTQTSTYLSGNINFADISITGNTTLGDAISDEINTNGTIKNNIVAQPVTISDAEGLSITGPTLGNNSTWWSLTTTDAGGMTIQNTGSLAITGSGGITVASGNIRATAGAFSGSGTVRIANNENLMMNGTGYIKSSTSTVEIGASGDAQNLRVNRGTIVMSNGTADFSNGTSGNTTTLRINSNGTNNNGIVAVSSNAVSNNNATIYGGKASGGNGAAGWFEDFGSGNGSILYASNAGTSPATKRYVAEFYSNDGTDAATLFLTNKNTSTAATALQIDRGRMLLSIEIVNSPNLSNFGYVSIISYIYGGNITTMPTSPAAGQILYIINNNGSNRTEPVTGGYINSGRVAMFIYDGGSWHRVN